MGVELSKIVIKMRNGVMFTIKGCFTSVYKHPFLVCLLSVLIFLYRSSPFTFSLLVSASPILVCTAVLLGTLLFFGQPNAPQSRIKEETEVSKGGIVEKNERKDESEQPAVGSSLSESKHDGTCSESNTINRDVLETNRELEEQKSEWNSDGEVMETQYASVGKANDQGSECDKSDAESFDSEMVNVDSLASSARSCWKQMEQYEDGEASESGSEQAESSSPDASMADDMIPMLDELHPLLDEDAPQPIQTSHAGSEAQSPRSSSCSTESVDETDNPDDSVAEDDDEDDDAQVDKGFRTKSVIMWTEEDQKNLMQVGSSEIERNQRLEKLILRRKKGKNMSMVPEINLIDLESCDFPINIPSISTSRRNPFDVPDDYVISGLPPIPGSAPSILVPRRNPFDIPYDSSEEKQNITGDESQSRDPFFRRRESFNAGSSTFSPNMQDLKMRPYFIPDEPSYSTLQQQPSEMSDSKVSSVHDTESVTSVEDQKLEEDQDPIYVAEEVGHGSQSSEGEGCLELGSVENKESQVNNIKKSQTESEAVETTHSRGSSISSLSEVNERAFTKTDDARSHSVPHKDPVYDSSPPDLSGVEQRSDENITDEQSHGDKKLSELQGTAQVEGQQKENHSVEKEETVTSPHSDSDFQEAPEKITTPLAGSSTSHFYVRAMHEKDFEHLDEVQVPNTPVEPSEKGRGIQNIHIPELRELDRDASLIPGPISKPEEAVSHVETRKMNEDAGSTNEGLVSKLDSSIAQSESGKRELEKHTDAERLSSPSVVEVNPVEVNKKEHEKDMENSRDGIDTSVVEVNPVEVNKKEQEMDIENSRDETDISAVEVNKIEQEMDVENSRDDIGSDHKVMMLSEEPDDAGSVQVEGEETLGEEKSSVGPDEQQQAASGTDTPKKSITSTGFFWAKRRLSTPFF